MLTGLIPEPCSFASGARVGHADGLFRTGDRGASVNAVISHDGGSGETIRILKPVVGPEHLAPTDPRHVAAQRPDIGNSFTSPPEAAAEMERRDRERREQAIEIEKLVTT
jgi:hypothetical protein